MFERRVPRREWQSFPSLASSDLDEIAGATKDDPWITVSLAIHLQALFSPDDLHYVETAIEILCVTWSRRRRGCLGLAPRN
jgi:hypothetical protein